MSKPGIFLAGILVFAATAFCAPEDRATNTASQAGGASNATVWRGESYRLTAKDVVKITVFQEEDLVAESRIGADGTINCPLVGSARIGGKTVPEATQLLQEMYKKYLKKPQVTLSIVEYAKRRFTILGQISKPGTYDMPDDSTLNLIEAVGLAGGYTRIADPSKVTLKRVVNGEEVIFKLNGDKMLKNGTVKRFEVLPGDTILVNEGWF
jgi:polysaccharide export outer membrane protein